MHLFITWNYLSSYIINELFVLKIRSDKKTKRFIFIFQCFDVPDGIFKCDHNFYIKFDGKVGESFFVQCSI